MSHKTFFTSFFFYYIAWCKYLRGLENSWKLCKPSTLSWLCKYTCLEFSQLHPLVCIHVYISSKTNTEIVYVNRCWLFWEPQMYSTCKSYTPWLVNELSKGLQAQVLTFWESWSLPSFYLKLFQYKHIDFCNNGRSRFFVIGLLKLYI